MDNSTNSLVLQKDGGNVGIGNSAPANGLDVGSNTTGLNARINATLSNEMITTPMVSD